jgi:flagellar motor protein MotB
MKDLNTQLSQLDANNRDLTAQVAQSEQLKQQMQNQIALLQQQLGDSGTRMKELQNLKDEAEKRAEAVLASAKARGGAILSANSSVKQNLQAVQIPGIEVHQEGEVIRLDLPADRMFAAGGYQLTQEGTQLVDMVGASLVQSYPKQRIVIEGHTDNSQAANAGAAHLTTGSQAQAVFQQLVTRNRFPTAQLSISAMGDNHPRSSNATPAGKAKNRRVEVVIYPETYAG